MIRAGLLEAAASAPALILAVLLQRRLCRGRISPTLQYSLWLLVLLRLLLPLPMPQSRLSVLNTAERLPRPAPAQVRSAPEAVDWTGVVPDASRPGVPEESGDVSRPAGGEQSPDVITLNLEDLPWLVWTAGSAAVCLAFLGENLCLARRLRRTRTPFEPGIPCTLPVYTAPGLPSPCLFGLFRPAIYLTPEAAERQNALPYILAHEETHFRHLDHIWALLRGAAAALYWWNPLVWLAAWCSRADCELACDEGALKRLGGACRLDYGRTLVSLAAARPSPRVLLQTATTMTGAKKELKRRLALIVKSPKTVLPILACALPALALAAACTFTGAKASLPPELEEAVHREILSRGTGGADQVLFDGSGDCIGTVRNGLDRAYSGEDHVVLGRSERDGLIRVLAMVLYGEYGEQDGELTMSSGFHIPTVLTFRENETGYELTDYWEPGDGTRYGPDLEEMREQWFPRVGMGALDTQRYIERQERRLLAQVGEIARADAARQEELDDIEERIRWRLQEGDWPEQEELVWDYLAGVEPEAMLDFRRIGIRADADATVRLARAYHGSELAMGRGWDWDTFANRLMVLCAEYYVEYDNTKTFVPSGYKTTSCWLLQDPRNGNWQIVPGMSHFEWTEPEASPDQLNYSHATISCGYATVSCEYQEEGGKQRIQQISVADDQGTWEAPDVTGYLLNMERRLDGRMACVSYGGRTWSDFLLLDLDRWEAVYQENLSMDQVRGWVLSQGGRMPEEDFTLWSLELEEAESPTLLRIRYQGDTMSLRYSGSFLYSLENGDLSGLREDGTEPLG